MEIVVIFLIALALAFTISVIKMVLTSMRKGFVLKKDHLYILIAYLASSVLLGLAFYVSFSIFYIFAALFSGLSYNQYILYCFAAPQIILFPIFTFLFFKNSIKTPEIGANTLVTPQKPQTF